MIGADERDGHRAFALPGSRLHYGPDAIVRVAHIDLELRPDVEQQTLDGVCTTTFRTLDEPVSQLDLNAVDLQIGEVSIDGAAVSFATRDHLLKVAFVTPLAPETEHELRIRYRVERPRHGLFYVLPSSDYPDVVAHAWTQSQDENARYWFPCIDHPSSKQTSSATVIVPRGHIGLSNGALIERRDEGDRTIFRYRQDVPHSTYLMTMVAGPFEEVDQGTAGSAAIPVAYYVLPGRRDDGERAFAKTPEMIDVFERAIGVPYPYARYSQIAVSDFIFGGMENTSATTQTDRTLHDERAHLDFSSDFLVSHELAHQWFGDLLTCRDWSHAWLNEGFATYFECVWREADLGYDEYLYDVFGCVSRYLEEDSDRYRRPIVCNRFRDPIEVFDRHLYEKGGAVLHMLRGVLGEKRFWRSINRYVQTNAQKNVETIDLIRAIEDATGRNMRAFFDQWVFRSGHPELEIGSTWDAQRNALTVTVNQKQTIDDDRPAYVFDVEIGIASAAPESVRADAGRAPFEGERRVMLHVARAQESITIHCEAEPAMVRFDPGAFVLASVTFTLGPTTCAALLRSDPDPIVRIRAARALAKDGSLQAREALAHAFAHEPFWGVLDEAASALGATRALWARELLLRAVSHEHPKVRRAVAAALGNFRTADVASALIGLAESDASYFVQAAALTSLGKTRDARAFDVLADAVQRRSWNGVVEAGAARGLAELNDARSVDVLIDAARAGRDEGLRRAAPPALARVALLVHEARSTVVDALDALLDDPMFLVSLAAIAAAEQLEDPRLLSSLDRLSASGFDGRVRRDAFEAAARIREAQKVPSQIGALRSDIDTLREDQRKLETKIETTVAQP